MHTLRNLLGAALVLACAMSCGAGSSSNAGSGSSLVDRLRADIGFLASDQLEGRGTPSRGLDLAALYLRSRLQTAGVQPAASDSYLLTYRVGEYSPAEAKLDIRINGKPMNSSEYLFWNIGRDPAEGPISLEMVFAGSGVVSEDQGVDELGALDVRGKAVVARKGAPWELDPESVFGPDRAMGKVIAATTRGAEMLVYLSDDLDQSDEAEARFFGEVRHAAVGFLREPGIEHASALSPILVVKPSAFARAVGQNIEQLSPGPLPFKVEVRVEASVSEATASNVVGIIPGRDPELADEWIALTAHYDHMGSHEVAAGEDGLWNGADDNASGTAAVLEIASRLAANPGRRSVLVIFTSGEDRGILGSAYYAAHPAVPMENLVMQLNLDMVGRSNGSVEGLADCCPALFEHAVEVARSHGIEMIADQQPTWRLVYLTDTYHFARAGIPYLGFFTGFHPDYHQPSDTADKIEYDALSRIVETAADLARHYVDGGAPPEFVRPKWFVTP